MVAALRRVHRRADLIVDARARLADSTPPPAGGGEYAARPEIQRALDGQVATGVRSLAPLGHDLLYVAVP